MADNYPPRWDIFDNYIPFFTVRDYGLVGQIGGVNRFAARYRAAKCLSEVTFSELSNVTSDGYDALTKLMFGYSAFESFLKVVGASPNDTSDFLTGEELKSFLSRLRELNAADELFEFSREGVNRRHRAEFDQYLAGKRCNPFFLASGIRHVFVHGFLTPNPGGGTIPSVASVSRFLTRLLFRVMDREFETRMLTFKREYLDQ